MRIKDQYIYIIYKGNNVYYVGRTGNLKARKTNHFNAKNNSKIRNWLLDNRDAHFLGIDKCDIKTILQLERLWINKMLDMGFNLLNMVCNKKNTKKSWICIQPVSKYAIFEYNKKHITF